MQNTFWQQRCHSNTLPPMLSFLSPLRLPILTLEGSCSKKIWEPLAPIWTLFPLREPETITSDRGPRFTSNHWFKLCEKLNISHRQTTAYHPESNGAVKRLHCSLKDALRALATMATWSKVFWTM